MDWSHDGAAMTPRRRCLYRFCIYIVPLSTMRRNIVGFTTLRVKYNRRAMYFGP